MADNQGGVGVYVNSFQSGNEQNGTLLLSQSRMKASSKKRNSKIIVSSVIIILLVVLGWLLLLAIDNGWFEKCTITMESDDYQIENDVMTISGLGEFMTVKISSCRNIKSIIVSENSMQNIPLFEINSIHLLICPTWSSSFNIIRSKR